MENKQFEYGEYVLEVREKGFFLFHKSDNSVLIDCSDMKDNWIVECEADLTKRNIYFEMKANNQNKVHFGISELKEKLP